MKHNTVIGELAGAVKAAKNGNGSYIDFYENANATSGTNQMLFFMKPELTDADVDFEAVAAFIFGKLEQYSFEVESGFVLSGDYLGEHRIIADHYGIINAAAQTPARVMNEGMWENLEKTFGRKRGDARLQGGIEYLSEHPQIDADTLSIRWLKEGNTKLGSGVYCQYREDEDVFLVNGFFPRLLEHFTKPGACIACFVLRGSVPWKTARGEFTGATAPEKAKAGSVRNELLKRREEFGLKEISPNLNGVHLSAGPVEGVVEILRFSARHESLADLVFGRMLLESFDATLIDSVLANGIIETENGKTTYFDLTEERDSGEAVEAIRNTTGK